MKKKLYFLVAFSLVIWNGSPLHSIDDSSKNEQEEVKEATDVSKDKKSILEKRLKLYGALGLASSFCSCCINGYFIRKARLNVAEYKNETSNFGMGLALEIEALSYSKKVVDLHNAVLISSMCLGAVGELCIKRTSGSLKNNVKAVVAGCVGGAMSMVMGYLLATCFV